jgi:hypothetical protein
MHSSRYRIGLVVDGLEVPEWVHGLVDWARDHPSIELSALIVHAPRRRGGMFERLFRLESRLLSRSRAYRRYARLYPIGGRGGIEFHARAGARAGDGFELDPADLSALESLQLDALVACSGEMPGEAVLKAAKDGLVSIRVGSAHEASAGEAGFLEVLEGRPETGFMIEKRQAGKRPPELLFNGSVATGLFFGSSLVALYARAFPYLQLSLERLAAGVAPKVEPGPEAASKPLGVADLLAYGRRTAGRSLGKAVRRFSGREFNWQVAFIRQPWSSRRWSEGKVIPNPPGAFLADPFTIKVDGVHYLFVEEYSFSTRKGVISAFRLEGEEFRRIGVVLEEPYHLSFPFVFRHEGEIYMVPESGSDRSVKIYRSTSFPTGWSEAKVLLHDVPAVDTTLFRQGPLWWMLTTIQGKGPGLNNAELHAFHAHDPFGEWTPHARNPVVMDARKGRNGGFLRDEYGNPCRVAQVPGFTFYGAGSTVYRIDEISPDTYRESPVEEVRPTFFPNLDGTHHVHSADGLTVYDFMRVERPRATGGGEHRENRSERAA